jgi:hypothetical protein
VGPIPFYDNVKIALMEEDWPDPDDVLGELYVYTSGNRSPATFTRDGAHYELQYGILAARSSFECDGAPGVYLYVHSDYRGNCTKFTEDFFNIRHFAIGNDTASSIRIVGCYNAELYEHSQYQGDSSAFHRDDPNLRNDKIGTDRTTSLRIRPCP